MGHRNLWREPVRRTAGFRSIIGILWDDASVQFLDGLVPCGGLARMRILHDMYASQHESTILQGMPALESIGVDFNQEIEPPAYCRARVRRWMRALADLPKLARLHVGIESMMQDSLWADVARIVFGNLPSGVHDLVVQVPEVRRQEIADLRFHNDRVQFRLNPPAEYIPGTTIRFPSTLGEVMPAVSIFP